jgi:hypothetical protein
VCLVERWPPTLVGRWGTRRSRGPVGRGRVRHFARTDLCPSRAGSTDRTIGEVGSRWRTGTVLSETGHGWRHQCPQGDTRKRCGAQTKSSVSLVPGLEGQAEKGRKRWNQRNPAAQNGRGVGVGNSGIDCVANNASRSVLLLRTVTNTYLLNWIAESDRGCDENQLGNIPATSLALADPGQHAKGRRRGES